MRKIILGSFGLFWGIALFTSGCSDKNLSITSQEGDRAFLASGFLQDYSNLKPSLKKQGAYVYFNPNKKVRLYNTIMLEPVQVVLNQRGKQRGLPQQDLQALAQSFEKNIRDALGYSYPIVEQPSAGTLLVRVAITDVVPSKPWANLTIVTSKLADGIGGASIEGEFIDSQSGELVAAFVDSEIGKAYNKSSGFSKYGHTDERLRSWAQLFRDRLDEARGLHTNSAFRTSGSLFQ